ncbi:ProQ/FinO family protein [Caenimonas sp. DR4.4]|uniref:ProQ/FinO family protein n=2 Tax=Caenimonas aquaedulcis TaxID=2793270 RepID=A0A931H5H4_9BURK|nr:ProQ/FinO family protein [Caenimonas aquaedulcis]
MDPLADPLPMTATAPRPPLQVLERLFQLYPAMFGARFLPLKLGVYQELLEAHPEEFTKEELKAALAAHARSGRYLESVAAGEQRHDLQGQPVEPVAPEHVLHAIMELFRRRQRRGKQDPRPWLIARVAAAIEASGLAKDAYLERVNTRDDMALGAIDEAFAQVSARAAKNEALRRAYQSSGKTVAEFADMYGVAPEAVEQALAAA